MDIGGSGVKTDLFEVASDGQIQMSGTVERLGRPPDWNTFERWFASRISVGDEVIGIACPGIILPDAGVVQLCKVAVWRDRPLVQNMQDALPAASRVVLINDAEAHLVAHRHLGPHPQVGLALGTSPGFALTDMNGLIARTGTGATFDIGALTIHTSASDKHIAFALGSGGLAELEEQLGTPRGLVQYGHRLGAFAGSLCSVFQPRTVVLSGGIIAHHWPVIEVPFHQDLKSAWPAWLKAANIVCAPHAGDAAMWGVARYAIECS